MERALGSGLALAGLDSCAVADEAAAVAVVPDWRLYVCQQAVQLAQGCAVLVAAE